MKKELYWLIAGGIGLIIIFLIFKFLPINNFNLSENRSLKPASVEPAKKPQSETKNLNSQFFNFSLVYPSAWEYVENASSQDLESSEFLPLLQPNENLVSPDMCVIHFGKGGGTEGLTDELETESIILGGFEFSKKTWFKDKQPILAVYLPFDQRFEFEYIHVYLPDNNQELCLSQSEAILKTINNK